MTVGASRGSAFVRLFQAEYPADVAGMVLVDPTAEDRLYVMFQGKVAPLTSLTLDQHRSTQPPANAVIPIPTRQPQLGAPFDRLPPSLYATRVALDRKLIESMPPTVSGEIVAESAVETTPCCRALVRHVRERLRCLVIFPDRTVAGSQGLARKARGARRHLAHVPQRAASRRRRFVSRDPSVTSGRGCLRHSGCGRVGQGQGAASVVLRTCNRDDVQFERRQ